IMGHLNPHSPDHLRLCKGIFTSLTVPASLIRRTETRKTDGPKMMSGLVLLMVHLDEENWVKAGVEFSDGEATLSSVLTVGQSDWATGRFGGDAGDFWIRATVEKGILKLQASADGKRWPLLRLSPFPRRMSYLVGPMCCTPERL